MAFSSFSNASLIKFSFEAFDFVDCCNNQTNIPEEVVRGTFIWEAESVFSSITSLSSINLTIDGYQYNVSDIGYISSTYNSLRMIGGLEDFGFGCGVSCVVLASDNDFRLNWDSSNPQLTSFSYTGSANDNGVWVTHSVNYNISILPTNVPEPSTLLLFVPCLFIIRRWS